MVGDLNYYSKDTNKIEVYSWEHHTVGFTSSTNEGFSITTFDYQRVKGMPPFGGIITASFRIANHQVVGQSPGVVKAPQHLT